MINISSWKKYKMKYLILILIITIISCFNETYKVDDFSADVLKWYNPYTKTDTVIFVSEKDDRDTIIFQLPESASDSIRDFEQGFSNINYLTVNYNFTKGSFHQFRKMTDGKTRYKQNLLNAYKFSSGYESFEISFIGTIVSKNIRKIKKLNDTIYYIDSEKADYSRMNVEKGIKSFKFSTKLGILEYLDDRNTKWKRK